MNNILTPVIVLAIVVTVSAVITIAIPYLKKRGVNVGEMLAQIKESIGSLDNTYNLLKPFFIETSGVETIDKILAAANVGVANAEQLYHIGQLSANDRKSAAREYIVDALGLMDVAVTSEVERLIDGAIEAEVLELGHKVAAVMELVNK